MGADPSYFLDSMEMAEAACFVHAYNDEYRDKKEQHRQFCHSVYNAVSLALGGQSLKLTDVFKYPWDNPEDEKGDLADWTEDEMKDLGKQFANVMNLFNKKNNENGGE